MSRRRGWPASVLAAALLAAVLSASGPVSAQADERPSAVTGVAAHPGDSPGELAVSWDAHPDGPRDGYRVAVAPVGGSYVGGEFGGRLGGPTSNTFAHGTTVTIEGLTPGGEYKVIVRARFRGAKNSEWSQEATGFAAGGPAYAPSGLAAAAQADGVRLSWAAPEADAGSVTGYRIERRRADGTSGPLSQLEADTGTAGTSYVDESVAVGGAYTYRVRALRGTQLSQTTNEATVVFEPPADPAAPAPTEFTLEQLSPQRLEAEAGAGFVSLSWDPPEGDAESVTGYEVLRRRADRDEPGLSTLVADTGTADTSYVDTTAGEVGIEYEYRVKALRGADASGLSNSAAAVGRQAATTEISRSDDDTADRDAAVLLPDLVSDPPPWPGVVEEATAPDGTELLALRFGGFVTNLGEGPLDLEGNPQLADRADLTSHDVWQRGLTADGDWVRLTKPPVKFERVDGHNHFHLMGVVEYSLWDETGTVEVRSGAKIGFCLVDVMELPDLHPDPGPRRYLETDPDIRYCMVNRPRATSLRMGVSEGWRDIYSFRAPFQWIDVSDVAPGRYLIGQRADPDNVIVESDEANNGLVLSDAVSVVPGYVAEPKTVEVAAESPARFAVDAAEFSDDDPGTAFPGARAYRIVTPPSHGTLDVGETFSVAGSDGAPHEAFDGPSITYTPAEGFVGVDSFTFAAFDRTRPLYPATPAAATVTLNVSRAAAESDTANSDETATAFSGTLGIGLLDGASPEARGYSSWSGLGALAPGSFELDGERFGIAALIEHGGGLNLVLGRPIPREFSLQVGGRSYDSRDSLIPHFEHAGRYWWPDVPQGWAAGDEVAVSIVLEPGTPAGPRPPAPPSAVFHGLPDEHNGRDPFSVQLSFDEPDLVVSEASLREEALQVAGGSVAAVSGPRSRGRLWTITLQPDGDGPVVVSLGDPADCADPAAVCAADGRMLRGPVTARIAGPQAVLSALQLQGATLSPPFASAHRHYAAAALPGVGSVTIEAESGDPAAVLEIEPADADARQDGHQVDLAASGETAVELRLDRGGESSSYWVVISRPDAHEPPSAGLNGIRVEGVPQPASGGPQPRSEFDAPADLTETTVVVGRADPGAGVDIYTVRSDGSTPDSDDADRGEPGHQALLSPSGDTLILVRVTSSDTRSQRFFSTLLRGRTRGPPPNVPPPAPPPRAPIAASTRSSPALRTTTGPNSPGGAGGPVLDTSSPGGPVLDTLSISGAALDPPFDPAVFSYDATAASDTDQVTVAAAAGSAGARVVAVPADADAETPGHQIALGPPGTQTAVAVAVSDGHGRLNSYLISVQRQPSTAAQQSGFALPAGCKLHQLGDGEEQFRRFSDECDSLFRTFPQRAAQYYRIVLGAAGEVALSVDGETSTHIVIRSPSGDVLAHDGRFNNPEGYQPALTHTLDAGAYIVEVAAHWEHFGRGHTLSVAGATIVTTGAYRLDALSVGGADLAGFAPHTLEYRRAEASDTTAVTVDPTPTLHDAIVSITPPDADAFTEGHQVGLAVGPNTVTVEVSSPHDVQHTTAYAVTVVRAQPASPDGFGWSVLPDIEQLAPANWSPRGIWSNGTTMWVADDWEDRLFAYDLATGARIASDDIVTTRLGTGNHNPQGLWSDGTTIWVSNPWASDVGYVYAYDLDTGAWQRGSDLNSPVRADNESPVGLWSDGETLWVADDRFDKIFAYDLAADSRQAHLDIDTLGAAGNNRPAGLWSDGETLWVADRADAKLYAYDLATGARRAHLDFDTLRGAGNSSPTGIWSDGSTMWVADDTDDKIYAYNMPADATLESLELTGVDIGFAAGIFDYYVHAPNTVTVTTVTAGAASADATVEIMPGDADPFAEGHQIGLSAGDNTITVTVTNANTAMAYTVVITQIGAAALTDDATLSALSLTGVDIGTFDAATTSYRGAVDHTMAVTAVAATTTDAGAIVTIAPPDSDTGTNGHQIGLDWGANFLRVEVESSDGTRRRAYTVRVDRAYPADLPWGALKGIDPLAAPNRAPRAIWSNGTTAWITDLGGRLHAYDLATGAPDPGLDITAPGTAGNRNANGMWSDGATVWVSDDADYKIYAYDLAGDARQANLDFDTVRGTGGNYNPKGIWSDGATMWVADDRANKVYAYDLAAGTPLRHLYIDTLRAAGNDDPTGLWSDGTTMWVADDIDDKIYAYDLDGGGRRACLDIDTLSAAGNNSPKGIWSDGATMWVVDNEDRSVYAYNMPGNSLLESFDLAGAEFEFAPECLDYGVHVPNTATVTTVTAEAASADATVEIMPGDADPLTGGHQIELSAGDNTITVTVTDAGTATAYTVVVTQIGAAALTDDATLSALSLTGADIGTFDAATTSYSADVDHTATSATLAATPTDAGAIVTIAPPDADAFAEGHQIGLAEGAANLVTVTVESSDGTRQQTYAVRVNRPSSADFAWGIAADIDPLAASNGAPRSIWSDGTTVWIADHGGRLYAYDLATGTPDPGLDITAPGTAGNRNAKGIWSDGTTVWVSDDIEGKIYAYDLDGDTRQANLDVRTLQAAGNYNPKGIWSDGSTMWVVDDFDNMIYAYDLAAGTPLGYLYIDTLRAAGNDDPTGLWSDGTTMWVADDADDKVYAYDLASGDRQADLDFDTLNAAGNNSPKGIWSDGVTMWVVDNRDGKVYAYNMPDTALR